jgi:hypothetical protein
MTQHGRTQRVGRGGRGPHRIPGKILHIQSEFRKKPNKACFVVIETAFPVFPELDSIPAALPQTRRRRIHLPHAGRRWSASSPYQPRLRSLACSPPHPRSGRCRAAAPFLSVAWCLGQWRTQSLRYDVPNDDQRAYSIKTWALARKLLPLS